MKKKEVVEEESHNALQQQYSTIDHISLISKMMHCGKDKVENVDTLWGWEKGNIWILPLWRRMNIER